MPQQLYDDQGKPIAPSGAPGTPPAAAMLYDDEGKPIAVHKGTLMDAALAVAHLVPGFDPESLKTLAQHVPDWLPVVGGTVGGMVGAAGGTAFGMGVGGVPGAVGGAALGGAAGESMRQLANRAMGKTAPATSGDAAKQIGTQAAIQGGSELVGQALTPMVQRAGAALMQSAIKPGLKATARAFGRGVAAEDLPVIETMVKEGVNVSPAGIAKLDRIISATNDDIAQVVKGIGGTPIDPAKVAGRLADVSDRVGQDVAPDAALAAVERVKDQFLAKDANTALAQVGTKTVPTGVLNAQGQMITQQAPVMGRAPTNISAMAAQAQKQAGYKALKDTAYGEMQGAEIEARKALIRGLKEDIAAEAQKAGIDIGAMNAREGAAIETKEAIAKRLAQAGNRDPVGLAWLASNPVHGLLYITEKSPAVKSFLGRGMYQQAAKISGVPEFVIRALMTNIAQSDDK